jgi:hypothetical protein
MTHDLQEYYSKQINLINTQNEENVHISDNGNFDNSVEYMDIGNIRGSDVFSNFAEAKVVDYEQEVTTEKEFNYQINKPAKITKKVLDAIIGQAEIVNKEEDPVSFKSLFNSKDELEVAIEKDKSLVSELAITKQLNRNERMLLLFMLTMQEYKHVEMLDLTLNKDIIAPLFTEVEEYDKMLRRAVQKLEETSFVFYSGLDVVRAPIIVKSLNSVYDNGRNIQIQINPALEDVFARFKHGNYLKFVLADVLSLDDKSLPLYFFMKQHKPKRQQIQEDGSVHIFMSEAKFQDIQKTNYAEFKVFKRKVLQPIVKDIDKNSEFRVEVNRLTKKEIGQLSEHYNKKDTNHVLIMKRKALEITHESGK